MQKVMSCICNVISRETTKNGNTKRYCQKHYREVEKAILKNVQVTPFQAGKGKQVKEKLRTQKIKK